MQDILSNYSIFFKNLILWIILQFIVACIISFLPDSLFNPHGWPYKIRKWEKDGKIYKELFKVKNWKNKLPVGKPFNKNDIDLREFKSKKLSYINKYMITSCKSEAVHIFSIFSMFIFFIFHNLPIAITIMLSALLINLPFIIILRYNRHRILKLKNRF